MYDIHCHLLPSIDDGAGNDSIALKMAEQAVADGIDHIICTPHIYPHLFDNTPPIIRSQLNKFKRLLKQNDIPLNLAYGADIQVQPELVSDLQSGRLPTLNQSRYFLFEPPHHIPLIQFDSLIFAALTAGYVPVITHPERLDWIGEHYDQFVRAADSGAWIQITAGSLTGSFGQTAQYWAEKLLDEGLVHIIASDAHDPQKRPLKISAAKKKAEKRLGQKEGKRLVQDRPKAIWYDQAPSEVIPPPRWNADHIAVKKPSWWSNLFKF